MCATCWATAAAATTGAAGVRAWAAAKRPGWLTDGRLRALTISLLTAAVLVASVRL
jgi:hypothetical protein